MSRRPTAGYTYVSLPSFQRTGSEVAMDGALSRGTDFGGRWGGVLYKHDPIAALRSCVFPTFVFI
jgi:hypothetical protein